MTLSSPAGRDCIVHYDCCCLPLLPPNISKWQLGNMNHTPNHVTIATPFEYNIDLHLHPKVEQMLKQKVDDNVSY